MSTLAKGFDRYEQSPAVNYEAARAESIRFAIHKATEGATWHDPTFAAEWAKSKAAGMIPGAYCFARPKTSTPQDEVAAYIAVVKEVGGFDGAFPAIMDLEDRDTGFTPEQMQAYAREWLTLAHNGVGRRPILYADSNFIAYYGLSSLQDIADLWIAAYDIASPNLSGFPSYVLWQGSDKGTVAGASPLCVDVFNGDIEAYVGIHPTAPANAPSYGERTAYQVRSGDTLSAISARYNVPVMVLARYNGIENPNLIQVDEWVRIPSRYVVRPGDMLSVRFPGHWQEVASLNAINPDRLWIGQVLYW